MASGAGELDLSLVLREINPFESGNRAEALIRGDCRPPAGHGHCSDHRVESPEGLGLRPDAQAFENVTGSDEGEGREQAGEPLHVGSRIISVATTRSHMCIFLEYFRCRGRAHASGHHISQESNRGLT